MFIEFFIFPGRLRDEIKHPPSPLSPNFNVAGKAHFEIVGSQLGAKTTLNLGERGRGEVLNFVPHQ